MTATDTLRLISPMLILGLAARYDNIWVTDNRDHTVMKLGNDGDLLMTLGIKGQAGTSDETFDRPANIAFGPNDELYVADGYGPIWVQRRTSSSRPTTKCGS